MKYIVFYVTLFCSALVNASDRSSGLYIGGNYWLTAIEADVTSTQDAEWEPGAIMGKAGMHLSPMFDLQARLGFGVNKDKTQLDSIAGAIGINTQQELGMVWGIYGLARLPTQTIFDPYAMLGYTQARIKYQTDFQDITLNDILNLFNREANETDTLGSVSYGLGVNAYITPNIGINAEYIQVLDKDDTDMSTFSLGLQLDF